MIRLDDALAGVNRLGFDTAPLIYFVERNPAYVDLVRAVLTRVETSPMMRAFSSVITLTEVLVHPLRTGNATLAASYRNILLNGTNFELVPIDEGVAENAARLRNLYRLRTPDALHIASALAAGCEAFLCNDTGLRRVTELHVLVLDDLEL